MRIQFCGADRTVTGSCHLVEVNGLRILLDFGLYQGPREQARRINQYLPDNFKSIDAIILSHGHLDHCGRLPVLVRHGYNGPIYVTPASAEVARIVLMDAAKIQEEDADYLNRRERAPGEEAVEPLYRSTDASAVLKLWKRVKYGQRTEIGNGVSFTFFDAGHILGSAYVVLEWNENGAGGGGKRLLFTADVGRYNSPILRDPQPLSGAFDYVITESTYGAKQHGPMEQVGPQLLDAVKYCVEHRSRLLVPSFAVGRTQTILWYMQRFIQTKQIAPLPVFVDSPMGVEVSRVHSEFRDYYDEETSQAIGEKDLFGASQVTFASSGQQSRDINAHRGAAVIIASSPTCEFGRILHHLKQSLENASDMIVFVGWTPPGTLGRRLQDGQKRVRVFDRFYDVKCQVRTIHGLCAHADGDELRRFLKPTLGKDTTAYVVHGEEDQAEGFARRLLHGGIGRANVPAMETSVITSAEGLPPPSRRDDERNVRSDGD
ncbi:MAG: metallo-beta-lactamase family protein [Phycisphaerales bacterium]|nr:metallo-beta-lactamase family protein [Phycisphaerales bacterium]